MCNGIYLYCYWRTSPLKASQIHKIIQAVQASVPQNTRIHLLGFAKADVIAEFVPYNITSFDTTSPLIRAFKDEKRITMLLMNQEN